MTVVPSESMPADLRDVVWYAGNGELAWPLDHALDAASWLAAQGCGLVGGELYERLPESYWGTFVDEWSTVPGWLADEPWPAFVERSLHQARAQLEAWTFVATADFKVCLIVQNPVWQEHPAKPARLGASAGGRN
jgi:hypothetical protein